MASADEVGSLGASPFGVRRRRRPRRRVTYAAIAVGGAAGGLLRYELVSAFPTQPPGSFPWTTLGINLGGAFVLAVLLILVLEVLPAPPWVRPLLGTGFLGAFTTWSTFMVEAVTTWRAGAEATALAYAAAAVLGGLAAAAAGLILGRAAASAAAAARSSRAGRE